MEVWASNIVINGDASNGLSGWETSNAAVERVGLKNYFHIENGFIKQSVDVSTWIIGVAQIRLRVYARVQEVVTDPLVQSYARVKLYLEDGTTEAADLYIENTDFATLEVIHDVNRRKASRIEIIIQGADLYVTDIACEKSFGVSEDVGDYIESRMPIFLYAVNNNALSIGTIQQYPLHIVLTHEEPTNLHVGLMIVGQASTALTLQVKFLLGGERLNFELNQTCASGWNTISANFLIPQLQPGSRRFEVQIQTSGGTFTVQVEHMRLFVMGANLEGGLSPDAPFVNWEEIVNISKLVARTSVPFTIVDTPTKLPQVPSSKAKIGPVTTNTTVILDP